MKSGWAIAETQAKFQIPALTLVERQAWPASSSKTWAKLSPANKNVGIIVAVDSLYSDHIIDLCT